MIISAQWLKTITREGLGKGAFEAVRQEPGNVFDDPEYAGAPILIAGDNYKHSVDVRSLQANTTYQYTVTQGSSVFQSTFKTAPTRDAWSSIRFIAMSDSETEPAGRVSSREWQPGAIAAGGQCGAHETNTKAR